MSNLVRELDVRSDSKSEKPLSPRRVTPPDRRERLPGAAFLEVQPWEERPAGVQVLEDELSRVPHAACCDRIRMRVGFQGNQDPAGNVRNISFAAQLQLVRSLPGAAPGEDGKGIQPAAVFHTAAGIL